MGGAETEKGCRTRLMATLRNLLSAWQDLIEACGPVFTQPSLQLFQQIATAWVLCPGRHTVTGMIALIPSRERREHDAYHRFFRAAAGSMSELWKLMALRMLRTLISGREVHLDLDDTLFHKSGPKVNGAGNFRDAVRSTSKRVVYALGLNLVVITLRVRAPWGGEPLGLPINVRLHRKGGPTTLDLAANMIFELEHWFPHHHFRLCADGAYVSLARRPFKRTHLTSRMRRDAALYDPPLPRKKCQRGRPRKKGKRLPVPKKLPPSDPKKWTKATFDVRGRKQTRLLWSRPVLWYNVLPDKFVLLVIARDPDGKQHDDYFFTTDLSRTANNIASQYAGRWSVEDTFRATKQFLHAEDPQCWKRRGPERAACLSFWLYSAIWTCYTITQGAARTWTPMPWYLSKRAPSFLDAIATLRRALWSQRISATSHHTPEVAKTLALLVSTLARAA